MVLLLLMGRGAGGGMGGIPRRPAPNKQPLGWGPSMTAPEGVNLKLKGGMEPLYLCRGCRFSKVSTEGEICRRCQEGKPRPSFSWYPDYRAGLTNLNGSKRAAKGPGAATGSGAAAKAPAKRKRRTIRKK